MKPILRRLKILSGTYNFCHRLGVKNFVLIIRESVSGRSWTSKVFNIVISLDTYQFFWQNLIFVKINGVFFKKRDKNIIWEVVTYLKSKKEMIFSRQFRTVAAVYHSLKIFRQKTTKTECPLAIRRFFFQNKRARFIIGSGHWTLHYYSNKPVDQTCLLHTR